MGQIPMRWIISGAASVLFLTGWGCSHDTTTRPLSPDAFIGGQGQSAVVTAAPTTAPAAVEPVAVSPPTATNTATASPVMADDTPAPTPGVSGGQFQIVDALVAVVNEKPIYASKILSTLDRPLHQKARALRIDDFAAYAAKVIDNEVQEQIYAELEFAAAQKTLDDDDRKLADELTREWRKQQIRDAGGSMELARNKARANGSEFEDLIEDQYRLNMTKIYYQRKIFPHIQVSADDMRQYYDRHRDSEFTEHEAAKYRVIKIDARLAGGTDKALDKAAEKMQRIRSGGDFARMAAEENDDPALAATGGFPIIGWMNRGAYVEDKVEQAVWRLQVGQVTDVISTGDAFYIAKLEDRRPGLVKPFESQTVQMRIEEVLRSEQYRKLRHDQQQNLKDEAAIRSTGDMMQKALAIAMQKYVVWAKE